MRLANPQSARTLGFCGERQSILYSSIGPMIIELYNMCDLVRRRVGRTIYKGESSFTAAL